MWVLSVARAAACAAVLSLTAALLDVPASAEDTAGHFTVSVKGATTAVSTFRQAIGGLRMLSALQLRSAVEDKTGQFIEGFFTARFHDAPVAGAMIAGRNGTAIGAWDVPSRAARTVPTTISQLIRSSGSKAGAETGGGLLPTHTVDFGTGRLEVPESWSIANSYQGCVEIASAHDHGYEALGCASAGLVPPVLPGTDPRNVLVLPYGSVTDMFRGYLQYPRPAGLGLANVRIIESRQVAPPAGAGEAAWMLFDYDIDGTGYRGLALANVAPIDSRSYMVYKSMFMTAAANFHRLAPTLFKSWQSWGVNQNVLNQRLFDAAKSMRETGDIINSAYASREAAQGQSAHGWSEMMRSTATLERVESGERWEGDWNAADSIVRERPEEYRIVPVGEL